MRGKVALYPMLIALLLFPGVAAAEKIGAKLTGFREVPAVSTVANGKFRARINRARTEIEYELTYAGLQAAVQQAHIHLAQVGVNGAIVAWLCGTPTNPGPPGTQVCPQSGTIRGVIDSDQVVASAPAQQIAAGELREVIAAIRAGTAYVNVHTSVSPGGEIRGQIIGGDHDDDDDDDDHDD